MSTGCCHLQGPFDMSLTPNLSQVGSLITIPRHYAPVVHPQWFEAFISPQVGDDLGPPLPPEHHHPLHHGGVRRGLPGEYVDLDPRISARLGNGEGSSDRPEGAVQTQFPHHSNPSQALLRNLSGPCQKTQGEGKIKGAPILPDVGWGQVDGDLPRWDGIPGVLDGGPDPLPPLPNGPLRQPDHCKGGDSVSQIHFYTDQIALHPMESSRDHLSQQPPLLLAGPAQVGQLDDTGWALPSLDLMPRVLRNGVQPSGADPWKAGTLS
jgi:hypothetical protein